MSDVSSSWSEQPIKGPITWRISAWAEISVHPLGWNFLAITWRISARAKCIKLGGKSLQESVLLNIIIIYKAYIAFITTSLSALSAFKTRAVLMPKFIFQPELKFECDYMRFLQPVWPSWMFQPGLTNRGEISSAGWNYIHLTANVFSKRSIQEAELKSQPG